MAERTRLESFLKELAVMKAHVRSEVARLEIFTHRCYQLLLQQVLEVLDTVCIMLTHIDEVE